MAITRIEQYHSVLKFFPPIAEPPHEDPDCMKKYWGRRWGTNSDVGQLRVVMMHRPGKEMEQIDESKWNDEAGGLIGDNAAWYWRDRKGPDIAKMQAQHDAYTDILRKEGVEVVYVDAPDTDRTRTVFTRDVAAAIPGGMFVSRLGPAYRRGEEINATKTLGKLGVPIIHTFHNNALFEGGNFAMITPKVAVLGQSSRTNDAGVEQCRRTLAEVGVELIVVPITGYGLHIDGGFNMVTEDTALINVTRLPWYFLVKLQEMGIRTVEVHPDDSFQAINIFQLRPGKIIMASGSDRTVERLNKVGVEVITIEYDEIAKNGGGPHCSTCPLMRDYI